MTCGMTLNLNLNRKLKNLNSSRLNWQHLVAQGVCVKSATATILLTRWRACKTKCNPRLSKCLLALDSIHFLSTSHRCSLRLAMGVMALTDSLHLRHQVSPRCSLRLCRTSVVGVLDLTQCQEQDYPPLRHSRRPRAKWGLLVLSPACPIRCKCKILR